MIVILFFRRILTLSNSPSISFSDLTATVASYFDMNTGSAEYESEQAVDYIYHVLFDITNLQGIGFLDSAGKPVPIFNLDTRQPNITFFLFRSSVNTNDIDIFLPFKSLSIEFSLLIL